MSIICAVCGDEFEQGYQRVHRGDPWYKVHYPGRPNICCSHDCINIRMKEQARTRRQAARATEREAKAQRAAADRAWFNAELTS